MNKIEEGKLRTFEEEKYFSLNEDSIITLSSNTMNVVPQFSEIIEEQKTVIDGIDGIMKIDGIESLQRNATCKLCKKKLTSTPCKLRICEICGLKQIHRSNSIGVTALYIV